MTRPQVMLIATGTNGVRAVPEVQTVERGEELEFVPGDGPPVHCQIVFEAKHPFAEKTYKFEGKTRNVGKPRKKEDAPPGDYAYDLTGVVVMTPKGPKKAQAVDPIIKIKDPPTGDP